MPQAVSGALAERIAAAEEVDDRRDRRGSRLRRRGPSIERAVKNIFMGLAFVMIALAIVLRMPGGFTWGYWLFLPA
ncbi:MAG TPA: hypothetical protein VF521_08410, partial [Pyrinomonadaceae bacterium]